MFFLSLRRLPFVKHFVGEWRCSRREFKNDPTVLCLKAGNALGSSMDKIGRGLSEGDFSFAGVLPDHQQSVIVDV
jgi:hypothetical protein